MTDISLDVVTLFQFFKSLLLQFLSDSYKTLHTFYVPTRKKTVRLSKFCCNNFWQFFFQISNWDLHCRAAYIT